jgi:protein-disulfide isomerase
VKIWTKEQNRRWLVVLGLLLVALILAGCGTETDGSVKPAVKAEDVAGPQTIESTPVGETRGEAGGDFRGFTREGQPYQGNLAAEIVIEEFSSFQCPYCGKYFRETYAQVMANYVETGQVLYIYRDFPLQSQPQSPLAAQAANCAGQIGGGNAFWEMHDHLFENQTTWSGQGQAAVIFQTYAAELGLDEAAFKQCLDSEATRAGVEADAEEGVARGVRGTPTFFINGQPLVGAQPYTVFAQALDAALAGQVAATTAPATPAPAPTPATIAPGDNALVLGNPDAPVTIVEFSDYQCPFCERHFQQTWPQLRAEFIETGRVRYVFKDFPLTNIHPQAPKAHQAARCAGEQNAYWQMHDRIFEDQSEWANQASHVDVFKGYATELNLDTAAFDACLDSGRWAETVNADLAEGASLGVRGTPTFFVNGYPFVGAQPYEVFQQAIQLAEQGRLGEALQAAPQR